MWPVWRHLAVVNGLWFSGIRKVAQSIFLRVRVLGILFIFVSVLSTALKGQRRAQKTHRKIKRTEISLAVSRALDATRNCGGSKEISWAIEQFPRSVDRLQWSNNFHRRYFRIAASYCKIWIGSKFNRDSEICMARIISHPSNPGQLLLMTKWPNKLHTQFLLLSVPTKIAPTACFVCFTISISSKCEQSCAHSSSFRTEERNQFTQICRSTAETFN